MKLLVVEHVLGSMLFPTHHNLMHALNGTVAGDTGWYESSSDYGLATRLYGEIDLKYPRSEVQRFMGANLLWGVHAHEPEAVLVINGHLQEEGIKAISRYTKVFLWSVDDPHELSHSSSLSQLCAATLTTEPLALGQLSNSYWFPHAVLKDEVDSIYEEVQTTVAHAPDVVVAGSAYINRVEWLNRMVPVLETNESLDVRCIIPDSHPNFSLLHPYWKAHASKNTVSWDNLQLLYGIAKCVLNVHRTPDSSPIAHNMGVSVATGVNQASYTVPAVGGTLLCDSGRQEGLLEQFEGHMPVFKTPEEMAAAVLDIKNGSVFFKHLCDEVRGVIHRRHLWKEHRMRMLDNVLRGYGVSLCK